MAAPANDNFASAQELSVATLPVSTTGTNVEATLEASENNHGGATNTSSVWYKFTAQSDGGLVISLTSTAITPLSSVYIATSPTYTNGEYEAVASNDYEIPSSTNEIMPLPVTSGQVYHIAVASPSGSDTGEFTIALSSATAACLYTNRATILGTSASTTADFSVAYQEYGTPQVNNLDSSPVHACMWYAWTSTDNGTYTFAVSSGDVEIGLFSDTAVSSLSDLRFAWLNGYYDTQFTLNAEQDKAYAFVVKHNSMTVDTVTLTRTDLATDASTVMTFRTDTSATALTATLGADTTSVSTTQSLTVSSGARMDLHLAYNNDPNAALERVSLVCTAPTLSQLVQGELWQVQGTTAKSATLFGGDQNAGTFSRYSVVSASGTFSNLAVKVSSAVATGSSLSLTLCKNSSTASQIVVTLTTGATYAVNTTDTLTVTAGDTLHIIGIKDYASPSIVGVRHHVEFSGPAMHEGDFDDELGLSNVTYLSMRQGFNSPTQGVLRDNANDLRRGDPYPFQEVVIPHACTLSGLYMVRSNSSTQPDPGRYYAFNVLKNGVQIPVGTWTTGGSFGTDLSIVLTQGDLLAIEATPLSDTALPGVVPATPDVILSYALQAANSGEYMMPSYTIYHEDNFGRVNDTSDIMAFEARTKVGTPNASDLFATTDISVGGMTYRVRGLAPSYSYTTPPSTSTNNTWAFMAGDTIECNDTTTTTWTSLCGGSLT